MTLKQWFQGHQIPVLIVIFFIIIGAILLGVLFLPELFYDQWIWRYYWGPVVADSAGHSVSYHGVVAYEGYTLVSELTYGIILVIALFGIYKISKKLQIVIDWRFCLSLMPYIVFGPVTRVLEDADYFSTPLVYWFISPLIYVQIATAALFFILMGHFFYTRSQGDQGKQVLFFPILLLFFVNIILTTMWISGAAVELEVFEPVVLYLISCFGILPLIYNVWKRKQVTVNIMLFSGGLVLILPSLYLVGRWIAGLQWGFSHGVRFDVFLLIIGLIGVIVGAVYFFSRKYETYDGFAVYQHPLNLAMIVGHLIDGLTSYVSIYDPLNMGLPVYFEKHPASNFLMEIWPPLFPIVKFLMIVVVIYLFDVFYKKELTRYVTLMNLVKIGILILGFSPGLRDLLRVTMGV